MSDYRSPEPHARADWEADLPASPSPFVEHVALQPDAIVRRNWIVRAWRWITYPRRSAVRRGR